MQRHMVHFFACLDETGEMSEQSRIVETLDGYPPVVVGDHGELWVGSSIDGQPNIIAAGGMWSSAAFALIEDEAA